MSRETIGFDVTAAQDEVLPAAAVVTQEMRAYPLNPGETLAVKADGWTSAAHLRRMVREAFATLDPSYRTPDE